MGGKGGRETDTKHWGFSQSSIVVVYVVGISRGVQVSRMNDKLGFCPHRTQAMRNYSLFDMMTRKERAPDRPHFSSL